MESTESRFAHLMQPIRELTKNWDIDVASELNDYLEELDEMSITFDEGKTRLNFAEAALLIQGSTCIYSKKVELLYSLVYQTLEYINDKNKKRSKQAAESQGDDAGGAANRNDTDDEYDFSPIELDVSERPHKADLNLTLSVAPLPPESLIPLESHEKQKLPLISVKGEVLCSLKDFRINIFIPGDEDMILLTSGSAAMKNLPEPLQWQDAAAPLQTQADDDAPADGGGDADAPADGGGDADAAAGGGGDADAADHFLPMEDDHMEQDVEEHVERRQAPSEGRMIRPRSPPQDHRQTDMPPPVDAWALHDMYAVLGEDKPCRPGKCYKVPDGLDDGGKRKRKQGGALQDFSTWFTGTFDPPEHKLKNGPSFTDLNYIYVDSIKYKIKTRKRILRRQGVFVSDEDLRQTFLQPEEAGLQQEGEEPGDDEELDPEDVPAEFGGGVDFISPDVQRDELSYEDLVKLRVDQLLVSSRGYTQETALSRRVKDWEEKIKPVLQQQEERPAYDIHEYSDRIVGALDAIGQRRSFASIVAGLDNFEVCKYMLASLQLANDATVELDSLPGLEESLDTMGLTLLSMQKATDRFKRMDALQ